MPVRPPTRAACLLPILTFLACGGSNPSGPATPSQPRPDPPRATTVTVAPGALGGLTAGDRATLTATVVDQFGATMTGATVQWSSSDASIASVSASGQVTAVTRGQATITATSGSAQGTAGVTVTSLRLLTEFGDTVQNAVLTDSLFAIWWDRQTDRSADAQSLLSMLNDVRLQALGMGLADPPNPARGSYYNVYIHVPGPGNDNYPDWGLGQSTDTFERPFLTIPSDAVADPQSVYHEGFHVFQYAADSPGFAYDGDTGWYVEAAAEWFAWTRHPDHVASHLTALALTAVPFQAMWRSWSNGEGGTPDSWNRLVRQYAFGSYLAYLSSVRGVPASDIVGGFYAGTPLSPQEYLLRQQPGLPGLFADWAARAVADFDYVSRAQYDRARLEFSLAGDSTDAHWYVTTLAASGTDGGWFSPPPDETPRGWSFNVVRLAAGTPGSYAVEFDGDDAGSEGAAAAFQVRALLRGTGGDTVQTLDLADGRDGAWTLTVPADQTDVYLVVASVAEHFGGNQTYGYRLKVTRQ